jgi:hypothetical protein
MERCMQDRQFHWVNTIANGYIKLIYHALNFTPDTTNPYSYLRLFAGFVLIAVTS